MNTETGKIERHQSFEAKSGQYSRFGQILLNQGAVEQVFIDYLDSKNIHVERHTEADFLHFSTDAGNDTQKCPVNVGVKDGDGKGMFSPQELLL